MMAISQTSLNDDDAEGSSLGSVINRASPFGPDDMARVDSARLLRLLFVDGLDPFSTNGGAESTYLLGRKGSGKTLFLHTPIFRDRDQYVLTFRSDDAYQAIADVVLQVEASTPYRLRTDHIADLWDAGIWVCAAHCITLKEHDARDVQSERDKIYAFCRALNPPSASPTVGTCRPDDVLRAFVFRARDQMMESAGSKVFSTQLGSTVLGGVDTRTLIDATRSTLQRRRTRVHALIDSLEDIHMALDALQSTLAGLFMFIGRHDNQTASRSLRVGCCFPAEMWPTLSKLSTNVNKDFRNLARIEWTTKDLLRIAARRFQLFAQESAPRDVRFPGWVTDSDLNTGEEALHYVERLLPKSITNLLQGQEAPLTYIVRHTQLLPRQLIIYLNRIFGGSFADAFVYGEELSGDRIRSAINFAEDGLWRETAGAFRADYPAAPDLVETIAPYLNITFRRDDIDAICKERKLTKKFRMDQDRIFDALLDVGCVGRVRTRQQRYVSAEFSYTVPGRLRPSRQDELCLHPMFSQIGSPRRASQPPVYPEGIDLEGIE